MDPRNSLPFILASILSALVIACWVIGVALALSRWRRHPRVSLFALLAFALLFISRFHDVLFPVIMRIYGWTDDQIEPILFNVVRLITALTSVVVWALLLCAIFGWRDRHQKQKIPPPSPSTFGNEARAQNATL